MVSHHQALEDMTWEAFFLTQGLYMLFLTEVHILVVKSLMIFKSWENVIYFWSTALPTALALI